MNRLSRAFSAWSALPAQDKLTYARLFLGGWLQRHHFQTSHHPLVDKDVRLSHRHGRILLGEFVYLWDGVGLSVFGKDANNCAELYIGDRTSIGARTHINSSLSIHIGKGCAISWDCEILDTDIHTVIFEDGATSGPAPVVIEDNVWIGTRSLVLKGVHIGTGSVIGAGSVVVTDIPPYSLAVGNPARPIKTIKGWIK